MYTYIGDACSISIFDRICDDEYLRTAALDYILHEGRGPVLVSGPLLWGTVSFPFGHFVNECSAAEWINE